MQAVYDYAEQPRNDDGTYRVAPLELEAAWRCHDLGVEAVLGEAASANVIRRVSLASRFYYAFISRRDYRDKNGATNWAEWARLYPDQSSLLNSIGGSDG